MKETYYMTFIAHRIARRVRKARRRIEAGRAIRLEKRGPVDETRILERLLEEASKKGASS